MLYCFKKLYFTSQVSLPNLGNKAYIIENKEAKIVLSKELFDEWIPQFYKDIGLIDQKNYIQTANYENFVILTYNS